MEVATFEPGDIVVERLTGKRAIVIRVAGPDAVTCRFTDGRLDDRFAFELQAGVSLAGALVSLLLSFFMGGPRERPVTSVEERVRPLLVRRSTP